MKIVAIRGRNLASLEGDFAVELEHQPLGKVGVFAITGPVGAGKTTLLDAMCLALFDRTPRVDRAPRALRVVDDLTASDPRGVLRRGAVEGFAQVDFEGRGGRRWRATWSVRRSRDRADGKLQAQAMVLEALDRHELIAGNKSDVLSRIEAELGLGWEQFRRSALLAQGDFAAFLSARPQERAELLERMTGTGLYAEIGRAAYRRALQAREALAALEAQVGTGRRLSSEDRAGLAARLERLDERRGVLRAAGAALAAVDRWTGDAGGRAQAVQAARAALARARAGAEVSAGAVTRLAAARALRPFRAVWAERGAALDARDRAEASAAASRRQAAPAAAEASVAASGLQSARAALAAGESTLQALAPRLAVAREAERAVAVATSRAAASTDARARADEAVSKVWGHLAELELRMTERRAVVDAAAQFRAAWPAVVRAAAAWPSFEASIAARVAASEHREAATRSANGAVRAAELAAVDLTQADVEAADAAVALREAVVAAAGAGAVEPVAATASVEAALAELDAARSVRADVRGRLGGLRDRLERWSDTGAAVERAATARAEASRERGEAESDRSRAQAEATRVSWALPEAEAALGTLEAAEALDGRRHELLRPEAPCPLCGSTVHPWADHAPSGLGRAVTEQRLRVAELRARGGEAREGAAAADARATAAGAREREAGEAMQIAEGARERAAFAWADGVRLLADRWPEAVELPEQPDDAIDETVAELEAAVEAAELRGEGERRRLAAARLALVSAIERDRAASVGLDRARAAEAAAAAADAEAVSRLASASARIAATDQELEGWLHGGPLRWRDEVEADPEAFVARLRADRAAWEDVRAGAAVAEADLANLEGERRTYAGWLDERIAARDAAVADLAAAEQAVADARASAAAVLDGRSAEEVEGETIAGVTHARGAAEAAARAAERCAAAAAEARSAAQRDEGLLEGAEARLQAADAAWTAARGEVEGRSGPLSSDALNAALAMSDLAFSALEAEVEGIEAVLRRASRELDAAEAAADAHALAAPDPTPLREWRADAEPSPATADALEADEHALDLERGQALAALAEDGRVAAAASAAEAELAARRADVALWDEMNELVGSADGARLRVFAQGLSLDQLVYAANLHLVELSPRYALARVEATDLDLCVVDRAMADEQRPVSTLSGGETFLASLALALGLSQLASHDVPVRTLFVDEGFGTLDPDALEVALHALDALQSTGRQVGLISHVPGLGERIGVRVEVTPRAAGTSQVRVVR